MSLRGKSYVALASLFVVAFATLVNAVPTPNEPTTSLLDVLEDLRMKLNNVAYRRAPVSSITFEELKTARDLYDSCDLKLKVAIRQNWNLRLVLDFAVNPMNIIGHMLNDPLKFDLFVIKLIKYYKHFEPGYAGETIGDGLFKIKTTNSEKLYALLRDPKSKIEMDHFRRARMEANNWRARHEEMTTSEDIYTKPHREELESILNYFNFIVYKPLYDHIYPDLDKYTDAEKVRQEYYRLLQEEHGIEFINGTPIQFEKGYRRTHRPGFTHVVTA